MKREALEAIVRDVIATVPDGALKDQHPGFQRLVGRWAAEESERTGVTISPEDYYARGRTARTAPVEEDAKLDEIVEGVRRG
jgi:hypothetical protein